VGKSFVRLWPGFLFAFGLGAQELAPIGIVRGTLVDCDEGDVSVRTADHHLYRFVVDGRTFIQRDHFRIPCSQLDKAEPLEIVSDRSTEPGMRYARLITVVEPEARSRRRALMAVRAPVPYEDPTLSIVPRGTLTFTGVVLRVDGDGLMLRTRGNGEKWILVRRDTHFRQDGLVVELSNLHSSTRVFVRGGPNLEGEIEAYEVVWGEILTPTGAR
jgi:hypothetical protein